MNLAIQDASEVLTEIYVAIFCKSSERMHIPKKNVKRFFF